MALLADWQIKESIYIEPWAENVERPGVISYGVSSYGYDVRLGTRFKVFTNAQCAVVDPKHFNPASFVEMEGESCLIPPNSFALAESLEVLEIPRSVLAVCVGKSTYARCGIIVNVTPLEPCVSADTEALTDQGWVPMSDVQVGDQLLTRREDGVAEYQGVEVKQERWHQGPLLHFQGRSVDQLVTPDHKLFVWRRNPRRNTEQAMLLPASEVFGKHGYSLDRKVTWTGQQEVPLRWPVGDSNFPIVPFLEFMGCWLGDGSAYVGNDGGYHVKLAVVTKDAKRAFFADVLQRLGVRASLHERGFEFFHKDLVGYLRQFGHAKNKFIDRRLLALPPSCLKLLLRGLIASDGNAETQTFTTSSLRLADDVQEAAFKAGYGAIVRRVDEIVFGRSLTAYKVRLCKVHMTPKIAPSQHAQHDYAGLVYDVTVPNHVFFCRRNGKASWTGNCWRGKITIEISNTTPLPARVYANEGIAQILFLRGESICAISYADKRGRYQDQTGLTLPFVRS